MDYQIDAPKLQNWQYFGQFRHNRQTARQIVGYDFGGEVLVVKRALWIAGALPVLYVAAYFVDVKPGSAWESVPVGRPTVLPELASPWSRTAEYRVGGEIARQLFAPLLAVDKRLRPDTWTNGWDEEMSEQP